MITLPKGDLETAIHLFVKNLIAVGCTELEAHRVINHMKDEFSEQLGVTTEYNQTS